MKHCVCGSTLQWYVGKGKGDSVEQSNRAKIVAVLCRGSVVSAGTSHSHL